MSNLYPYTDFHEMNLDWVINKVKELATAWAQVQVDWSNQQEAFNTLKSWIENYFANLNVQVEINNKLDELVLNGTMSELIAPYVASGLPAEVADQIGAVVANQIGAVVAAQIGAVVADQLPAIAAAAAATEVGTWLSTHIDPDTGYVIDDTLTTQYAAADAKATGDKISELKSALSDTKNEINNYLYITKPYDRQIFDVATMIPSTPYNIKVQTNKSMSTVNAYRLYPIEVNGVTGDTFRFNLIDTDTPVPSTITDMNIIASDVLPNTSETVQQLGTYSVENKRATIALTQNSKYIYVMLGTNYSNSQMDEITADCNDAMAHIVVRKNLPYDTTYYSYAVYPIYKVLPIEQGVENADKIMMVDANGNVVPASLVIEIPAIHEDSDVVLRDSVTINISDDVIENPTVTLGSGWSGNMSDGFAHVSGSASEVNIAFDTEVGEAYIVTLTYTNIAEGAISVALGNSPYADVYDGTIRPNIGFISDGGVLKIKALASYVGSVSAITCKKVGGNDSTITLNLSNITAGSDVRNITGFWNVAMSASTMSQNQNGSRNIGIGLNSLQYMVSGTRNIAIGTFALRAMQYGSYNIAIGADSLWQATNVLRCIALGFASHVNGNNSRDDVAIGEHAMGNNDSASNQNVCIGNNSGYYAHNSNTHIGHRAGYYTKGNYNTSVGVNAGSDLYITGNNNVCIGKGSGFKDDSASGGNVVTINNSIAIGADVKVTESNQVRVGKDGQTFYLGGKKLTFGNDGIVRWE